MICILAALFPRKVKKNECVPTVAFIVIAYNEIKHIRQKIENILSLDYPRNKVEYYIVSDCSDDGTDDIIRSYEAKGIRYIRLSERKGKIAAINNVVPSAHSEIIVFSDARQLFNKESIRELVVNFSDDKVGAVSGELILNSSEEARSFSEGIKSYWNYEKFVRKCESRFDSVAGITGCIYAMRRILFEPIPEHTLLDDFIIPMNVIKKGYRVVFEKRAQAFDFATEKQKDEFRRKLRTLTGNFQAIGIAPFIINPFKNRIFFQYVSHKLLRLLVPYLLICLLIASFFIKEITYQMFFYLQCIGYALGLLGFWLDNKITGVFNSFLVLNTAAFLSFYQYTFRKQRVCWK